MLKDISTYTLIKKSPLRMMTNNLKCLLTRWKNSNYISDIIYRILNCSHGIVSWAYGFPRDLQAELS